MRQNVGLDGGDGGDGDGPQTIPPAVFQKLAGGKNTRYTTTCLDASTP